MTISIVIFVLLIVISGLFLIQSKKKNSNTNVVSDTPVVTEAKRLLWDDPSGFTFTHDSSLIINSHTEDEENYAHVELTKLGENGKIIVWASDTSAQTLAGWVGGNKRFTKANTMDTTLGGQPAIKINGLQTSGVLTTGTLYDGLIFYIDAYASESAFLTEEFEKISDSFFFKPIENSQTDGQSSDSNEAVFDEEEIVE